MSDFNVDFDKLGKSKIENGDMIPLGGDHEYHAEFTIEKVPNFDGTDYTEVPHLRLQAPGNTKAIYHQPVRMESAPGRPSDPERFPRQWAAFQAGNSIESGTSIYDWEGVTPGDARRFDLNGIKTVQQLAHVSDVNLSGLGVGAMALRDRARAFLSGNTGEAELARKNAELSDQVGKLTDIVNSLLEKQEVQPASGRKTKEKVDG